MEALVCRAFGFDHRWIDHCFGCDWVAWPDGAKRLVSGSAASSCDGDFGAMNSCLRRDGPAHSLCLVQKGSLRPPEAAQALKITLQDLGIVPAVLTNPLVEAVSPRFQALLDADCSLDPKHEEAAHALLRHEL